MFNLNNYMSLSVEKPNNNFSKNLNLETYCSGMVALGLFGDLSSTSRVVKVIFTKMNTISGKSEKESVRNFFFSFMLAFFLLFDIILLD